ncbi:MAG: hypothetical protein ABSE82_10540 [Nitrososphaerales archaeon]|jgi:hypothetical protein
MANQNRPAGIVIVAVLMVVFGLAEIATGFTHNFLGLLSTASVAVSTFWGMGIGALYAIGGIFLLTMKRWAAIVAEACLIFVIIGRINFVAFGYYPLDSFLQTFSIVVGTALAIFFAIYIGVKWKSFR